MQAMRGSAQMATMVGSESSAGRVKQMLEQVPIVSHPAPADSSPSRYVGAGMVNRLFPSVAVACYRAGLQHQRRPSGKTSRHKCWKVCDRQSELLALLILCAPQKMLYSCIVSNATMPSLQAPCSVSRYVDKLIQSDTSLPHVELDHTAVKTVQVAATLLQATWRGYSVRKWYRHYKKTAEFTQRQEEYERQMRVRG